MGAMVKEKLLLPVDAYIAKYGWDKRQSDSVLARDRWSDTGQFGEGKTYGISGLGEMVGLYYNKKLLDERRRKDADRVLRRFPEGARRGQGEGHRALHDRHGQGPHGAAHARPRSARPTSTPPTAKTLDDLIYDRGGTWKTQGNLDAAKQMLDWAKDGYFYRRLPGHLGRRRRAALHLGAGRLPGFGHLVSRRHAEQPRHPLHAGAGAGRRQGAAHRRRRRSRLGDHQPRQG